MVSGQWFHRKGHSRNWSNIAQITHNSKIDVAPDFNKLVGVHPRNIQSLKQIGTLVKEKRSRQQK